MYHSNERAVCFFDHAEAGECRVQVGGRVRCCSIVATIDTAVPTLVTSSAVVTVSVHNFPLDRALKAQLSIQSPLNG